MKQNEKNIISYLDADARMPYSAIAKRIRRSQQSVSYTVSKLQDEKAIKSFLTVIDYARLSMLQFRVLFRLSYTKESTLEDILVYFNDHPNTAEIQICGGSYDLIVTFFAPNPSQFNKILRNAVSTYSDQLKEFTILTTIVERWFGRKYLDRRIRREELIIGGDRVPAALEDNEIGLLQLIATDARASSVDLASKLDASPKTVIRWIKDLEGRKVVLGYRLLLDASKIGFHTRLLLVRYHNVSIDMERKLTAFLKQHPHVTRIAKTLGEWDLAIEVEVEDPLNLRKIERRIRERFSQMIHSIIYLQLYDTVKKRYMPSVQ